MPRGLRGSNAREAGFGLHSDWDGVLKHERDPDRLTGRCSGD